MTDNTVPGPVPAVVTDINDPQGQGCIKARVPGLCEPQTHFWCTPMGWPGAGAPGQGSRYPMQLGAQVMLFFLRGDPDLGAAYLPSCYGAQTGVNVGPTSVTASEPSAQNERVCLWEDERFAFYITMHAEDRRLAMVDKVSGSSITLDATDGDNHKSISISIEAQTGILLKTDGLISLRAGRVEINGKPVMAGRGGIG